MGVKGVGFVKGIFIGLGKFAKLESIFKSSSKQHGAIINRTLTRDHISATVGSGLKALGLGLKV